MIVYDTPTSYSRMVINGEEFTEVNTEAASAIVEVKGTDGAVLIPSLTSAQRAALDDSNFTVQGGMKVFDTTLNAPMDYIDNAGWVHSTLLIKEFTIVFDNEDIRQLSTAPFTLLDAPGEGFFYSILHFNFSNVPGGVPFTGGNELLITYGAGPLPQDAISQNIPAALITSGFEAMYFGSGYYGSAGGSNEPIADFSELENQPLVLSCDTAFAGGTTAVVSLTIQYRIVTI